MLGNNLCYFICSSFIIAGISSTVTAGMAGASIYAGISWGRLDVEDPSFMAWHFIDLLVGSIGDSIYEDPFYRSYLFIDGLERTITLDYWHLNLFNFIEESNG